MRHNFHRLNNRLSKTSKQLLAGLGLLGLLAFFPVFVQHGQAESPKTSLTAEDILKKVDEYAIAPQDQFYKIKMAVRESSGEEKTRELSVYQKGREQRLITFTAPANIACLSILSESKNVTYVYLPDYKRIRRIAAHNMKQTSFGSDFTSQDMNMTTFGDIYDGKILSETATAYLLECSPKAGQTDYDKLKISVIKENFLVDRIEYYSPTGALERVQTREKVENIAGRLIQKEISMTNMNTKHSTIQYVVEAKFNQGLKDDMFSKKSLTRCGQK
jgi:hypothetical protein